MQLESISGVESQTLEQIQLAVNSYYHQFEDAGALPGGDAAAAEETAAEQPEPEERQTPESAAAAAAMPGMPVEGEAGEEAIVIPEEVSQDFDTMGLSEVEEEAGEVMEDSLADAEDTSVPPEVVSEEGNGDDAIAAKE